MTDTAAVTRMGSDVGFPQFTGMTGLTQLHCDLDYCGLSHELCRTAVGAGLLCRREDSAPVSRRCGLGFLSQKFHGISGMPPTCLICSVIAEGLHSMCTVNVQDG
jgi:hypothetical protein